MTCSGPTTSDASRRNRRSRNVGDISAARSIISRRRRSSVRMCGSLIKAATTDGTVGSDGLDAMESESCARACTGQTNASARMASGMRKMRPGSAGGVRKTHRARSLSPDNARRVSMLDKGVLPREDTSGIDYPIRGIQSFEVSTSVREKESVGRRKEGVTGVGRLASLRTTKTSPATLWFMHSASPLTNFC